MSNSDFITYSDGSISEDFLEFIEQYIPSDDLPIMKFLEIIEKLWWPSYGGGFKLHRKYKGRRRLEMHTGGWSDNELIIRSLKANILLMAFQMRHVMWKVGGHFYFQIKE